MSQQTCQKIVHEVMTDETILHARLLFCLTSVLELSLIYSCQSRVYQAIRNPSKSDLKPPTRAPYFLMRANLDVGPVPVGDRREVGQRVIVEADEDDVQDDPHLGGKAIHFFWPENCPKNDPKAGFASVNNPTRILKSTFIFMNLTGSYNILPTRTLKSVKSMKSVNRVSY